MSDILSNKEKWTGTMKDGDKSLCQRTGRHDNLEQRYERHESKDAIISDGMLIQKAKMYGNQLGDQEFACSKGWQTEV